LAGEFVLEVRDPAGPGVQAAHFRQGSFDPVPGDDPLIPSLSREAAKGNVIVHRAHKRAVIHSGNQYIKVFRPGRAVDAAGKHRIAASLLSASTFTTPRILDAGPDVLVFSSLSGRPYYELGQDHSTVTDSAYDAIWSQWSRAWVSIISVAKSADFRDSLESLPFHPAETEVANLQRWINHWLRHSHGVPEAAAARSVLLARAEAAINGLRDSPPDPLGWAHGDLHDKQIFGSAERGGQGLLDFDESCRAETALDLANLDVHVELRLRQKLLTTRRYVIAHRRIVATAEKLHVSPERFAAYTACTKLRLACLYSFRPPWGANATEYLLARATPERAR
jgi:aminoglycoside/choline kinase family phosphotransferase